MADGTICLMRHGETEWNRVHRIMSHLPIGLNAAGVAQARAAGSFLKAAGIGRIVSSPLARARQTAEAVAGDLHLEVEDDRDLTEVNFGGWEGLEYAEILGRADFQSYAADPVRVAPPGGETLAVVQQRGLAAIARALSQPHQGPVLIVSHGDLIRSVLCHLLAMDLSQFRRLTVDNGSLTAADLCGGRTLVRFVNLVPDPARTWRRPVGWGRTSEL